MVRGLMPSVRPASLLEAPAVNCSSTSRSRRRQRLAAREMQRSRFGAIALLLPARIGADRLVHPRHDLAAAERLLDEVERAVLDGADRDRDVALAGNHEDRRRIVLAVQFLQHIEARLARNVHVEQDAAGVRRARPRAMLRRRRNRSPHSRPPSTPSTGCHERPGRRRPRRSHRVPGEFSAIWLCPSTSRYRSPNGCDRSSSYPPYLYGTEMFNAQVAPEAYER